MSTVGRQQPGSGLRARLLNRGAYQWYAGTIVGLLYQISEFVYIWSNAGSTGTKAATTVLLSVFYLGYVFIPPLIWPQSVRTRVIVLTAYWLATFALLPLLGVFLIWVWVLVIAMVTFTWMPLTPTIVLPVIIILCQTLLAWRDNFVDGTIFAPFVTITTLVSLLGITRQIIANHALRDAQATIATLAAAEERARLARDLHDVLGHSLTVVAVKSELAGRLVERDPKKAAAEISDIEQLARTALADLRAAVTSYREMNLDAELSAAKTALEAAGIDARLPANADAVDEDLRPLFCWVLREGVTNVIRHSNAKRCWVELEPRQLRVRDDGTPAMPTTGPSGNGIKGLTERAAEAGATLSVARGAGGFSLTVVKAAQ